jgi:hypothetical protein
LRIARANVPRMIFILFPLAFLTWWGVYTLLGGTPLRLFDWKWKVSDIWKSFLGGVAALAVMALAGSLLR